MKVFKKVISLILTAAIMMSMICVGTVSAGAASILDTAKSIKSGRTYSSTAAKDYTNFDYKISVNKSGSLKIKVSAACNSVRVILYDSAGNEVKIKDCTEDAGYIPMICGGKGSTFVEYQWDTNVKKAAGTIEYTVGKGTYYIRVTTNRGRSASGEYSFKATFPNDESKYKVKYLSITLNKGNSIDLGVSINTSEKVNWTSSNSKVVNVSSSGKITAISKGSAIIVAKAGNSSKKIKIIVK